MKSKLVRDNIPMIIREAGKTPITHIAADAEARKLTIAKVFEELTEFQEQPCLEEAADVYQSFMMMINVHDLRFDDVISAAVAKSHIKGRFDKLIILDKILDEQG